jgi:hypothetical protein
MSNTLSSGTEEHDINNYRTNASSSSVAISDKVAMAINLDEIRCLKCL